MKSLNQMLYPHLIGGMQDYNYIYTGCLELTLELSCCIYPDRSDLPSLWADNQAPLIRFLEKANTGEHSFLFLY